MEPVNISSYNDDPPPFLLSSADEVAPIPLGLVISIFTCNALVLCLLGLVTTYDPEKWSMSMKPTMSL
jgi:conjugal transfer pilus assembly protein TraL